MTLGLQGQHAIPSAMGDSQKFFLKSLIFGSKFGFRSPLMMEKMSHNIGNYVSPFEMWIQLVKVSA